MPSQIAKTLPFSPSNILSFSSRIKLCNEALRSYVNGKTGAVCASYFRSCLPEAEGTVVFMIDICICVFVNGGNKI